MNASGAAQLIDQVDTRDRVVGTMERRKALEEGINFRTAHVFVFDGSGLLLLQRLADSRDRHPGRWGSSVAAYVGSGETYLEAASRRLREELCLSVPIEFVQKIEMGDEGSRKFVSLFTAESDSAEICETDHIAELGYWDLAELRAEAGSNPARFTPTLLQLLAAFRR